MAANPPAQKVAVLGGGIAGLTAAYELSKTPELRKKYEVTVYQRGWRLGGKGASGRNKARYDRIEEHGLHMWFGFYQDAFRMMEAVVKNVDQDDWPSEFERIEHVFSGCNSLLLWDRHVNDAGEEVWRSSTFHMPEMRGTHPWDPEGSLPTFWDVARKVADLLKQSIGNRPEKEAEENGASVKFPSEAMAEIEGAEADAAELSGQSARTNPAAVEKWAGRAQKAADLLVKAWGPKNIRRYPGLRVLHSGLDLTAAGLRGMLKNDAFEKGLDVLNEYDLIDFFRDNGASTLSVGESETPDQPPPFKDVTPLLRAIYDVAFLFDKGNTEVPSAAAGTAINDLLRLVTTYRGNVYYKMNAGMGDAIFTPLYQVLKRRNVKFRFFAEVEKLHVAKGQDFVSRIDVVKQARIKDPDGHYNPLVKVKQLWCWPSQPLWDQLNETPVPDAEFETRNDPFGRQEREPPLIKGKDFDHVVLAIPVGALDTKIAEDLIAANPAFEAMVRNSATVATQAFQVWLALKSSQLGKAHQGNVSATYIEPLDTYCDMSHLIRQESWPPGTVRAIGYFCGVLPDPTTGKKLRPAAANLLAHNNAIEFLSLGGGRTLWPGPHAKWPGTAIDWKILFDPDGGIDDERFESQYWRGNVADWERYVTTPKCSIQYRRAANESGFKNVVLAGDWTKNGIDGGCVEAAVRSGRQAADAILNPSGPGLTDDGGAMWLDPPKGG